MHSTSFKDLHCGSTTSVVSMADKRVGLVLEVRGTEYNYGR